MEALVPKVSGTKRLPLPSYEGNEEIANKIEGFVDQIQDLKITGKSDVSELENKIDLLIYELYKLTKEEITHINNSFSNLLI